MLLQPLPKANHNLLGCLLFELTFHKRSGPVDTARRDELLELPLMFVLAAATAAVATRDTFFIITTLFTLIIIVCYYYYDTTYERS
jgi:hypothetical protein